MKPMEWVRLVADDDSLSSHAVAVAHALATHCGRVELVYRSNVTKEQLSQRTHLGRTSVRQGLRELLAAEWIARQIGGRTKTGRQQPNDYWLTRPEPVDNSAQGSPHAPWPGSPHAPWNDAARHNQGSPHDPSQVSTYKGYRKSTKPAVDNRDKPASENTTLETQLAATATRLTVARG